MLIESHNRGNLDSNLDCQYGIQNLYSGEEAEGFDVTNGSEWIYPTNYPVREYQKNIVSNALFKNTLVCLPTGLGKTFIAAVVMFNFHRWYPKNIVVFMAHSKPLVAQQVHACCNIMGIPPSLIAELNGNMIQSFRKKQWASKKIFFLTPQVFNNDLARGNVKAESIRCIVVDEAHKALGNQAYCQVIRSIKPFNNNFRVLALSATPGDDMNMVKEVIQNLMISHLEVRNETDPDIKPYLHEKKIETVVVKLSDKILEIKERFLVVVDKYIKPLVRHKLIPQSFSSINSFSLVLKQKQFIQDSRIGPELRGIMLSNFSVSISLFHALEELMIHGIRSFVNKLKCLQSGEGATNKSHYRLGNDLELQSLIKFIDDYLGPDQNISFDPNSSLTRLFDEIDSMGGTNGETVYSHPKFAALEEIILKHFESCRESTRVIVFCKSRQCTGEICNFLARFKPLIKPMIFIGQSHSTGGIVSKGFNQAAQLNVMKRFRDGIYNTLIATCVAEEGLDIGEVDLIINFDSGKNSNTQVQRSGRTGRKRDGRVVNLVTEGKEHQNYNISISKGNKIRKRIAVEGQKLPFYLGCPRMIPKGINPVCQEMFLLNKSGNEEELGLNTKKKSRTIVKKRSPENSEESNRKTKKMREKVPEESGDFSCGPVNLWTMIGSPKDSNNVDSSEAENRNLEIGSDASLGYKNELEIVQENFLYEDDVGTCNDILNHIPVDDIENGREMVKFLKENAFDYKTNFKELVDLKKCLILVQPLKERKSNALDDLMATQKYKLSENDLNYLNNESFSVDSFVDWFRRSRTIQLESSICEKPEVNNEKAKNVVKDPDLLDFIRPTDFNSSISKLVSSTPLRKKIDEPEKEDQNRIPDSDTKIDISDLNFDLWEDEFVEDKKMHSLSVGKNKTGDETSLISITQALDLVQNLQSDEKKSERQESPAKESSSSSPVLMYSQRVKSTQSRMTSSQFQSQGARKRESRKSLMFQPPEHVKLSTQTRRCMDSDSDDLFAEIELERENEIKEKHSSNVEGRKSNSPVIRSGSSSRTVDYDLGDFDENVSFGGILKLQDMDRSKLVGDGKRDSKPTPKLAVVRPLGFENTCSRETSVKQVSFACDFSLFGDDDFNDILIQAEVKEKEKPDEMKVYAEIMNEDSSLFLNCSETRNGVKDASKSSLKEKVKLFMNISEEELSDGAVEAIKAVEMYERDAKLAEKAAESLNGKEVILLDSDDSDEFFLPGRNQTRKRFDDKSRKKASKKKVKEFHARKFIEMEAQLTEGDEASSDEENTSGLDEYDSSFVDEREVLTQAPNVDMTAKYLQSTKSPLGVPGAFKIPKARTRLDMNVYSQVVNDTESDYENDSFCVQGDDNPETEAKDEMTELELAELVLENKKKRKRRKMETPETKPKTRRKLRRVLRIESDSSGDEPEAQAMTGFITDTEKSDIQELFEMPFSMENEETFPKVNKCERDGKWVLFVASRQIASAPEVTTCLRAKWNANVHVRSTPEADYIVSWRVGINRMFLSDFANGSAASKNSIKETVQRLTANFPEPVLIIEDDKNKGLPLTTGCHKLLWARHSYRTIAKLTRNSVMVLHSKNKEDTARIIAVLADVESKKGHRISIQSLEIAPAIERRMKFYSSLTGVNVANAYRISTKYSTISSFMNSCDSVQALAREFGLKRSLAAQIYQSLFSSPVT